MTENQIDELLIFLESAIENGDKEKIWDIYVKSHIGSDVKKQAAKAYFELCSTGPEYWKLYSHTDISYVSEEIQEKAWFELEKLEEERRRTMETMVA